MAGQHRYEEEELEQILKIAARKSLPSIESHPRARLEAMANELGIAPEALAEAELEFAQSKNNRILRAEFDRERRSGFFSHLVPYFAVNAFLAFISVQDGKQWFLYCLAGWGIGLLIHCYNAFNNGPSASQEFEQWRVRRQRMESLNVTHNADRILEEFLIPYKMEYRTVGKIETIKHLRDVCGIGLAEAKDYVEHYAAKNPGTIV
jgi:hypothetical protein